MARHGQHNKFNHPISWSFGGHGFVCYPKDDNNKTGFYFPDEPAFVYPTEHPYPPKPVVDLETGESGPRIPLEDKYKKFAALQSSFSTKDNEWKYTVKEKQFLQSGNQFYFPRKRKKDANGVDIEPAEWVTTGDVYSWWHSSAGDAPLGDIYHTTIQCPYRPYVDQYEDDYILCYYTESNELKTIPSGIIYKNGKSLGVFDCGRCLVAAFSFHLGKYLLLLQDVDNGNVYLDVYGKVDGAFVKESRTELATESDIPNMTTYSSYGFSVGRFNYANSECSILVHTDEYEIGLEIYLVKGTIEYTINEEDNTVTVEVTKSNSKIFTYPKREYSGSVFYTKEPVYYVKEYEEPPTIWYDVNGFNPYRWSNYTNYEIDPHFSYQVTDGTQHNIRNNPQVLSFLDVIGLKTRVTTEDEYQCPIAISYSDDGELKFAYIKSTGYTKTAWSSVTKNSTPTIKSDGFIIDKNIVIKYSSYFSSELSIVFPEFETPVIAAHDSFGFDRDYHELSESTWINVNPSFDERMQYTLNTSQSIIGADSGSGSSFSGELSISFVDISSGLLVYSTATYASTSSYSATTDGEDTSQYINTLPAQLTHNRFCRLDKTGSISSTTEYELFVVINGVKVSSYDKSTATTNTPDNVTWYAWDNYDGSTVDRGYSNVYSDGTAVTNIEVPDLYIIPYAFVWNYIDNTRYYTMTRFAINNVFMTDGFNDTPTQDLAMFPYNRLYFDTPYWDVSLNMERSRRISETPKIVFPVIPYTHGGADLDSYGMWASPIILEYFTSAGVSRDENLSIYWSELNKYRYENFIISSQTDDYLNELFINDSIFNAGYLDWPDLDEAPLMPISLSFTVDHRAKDSNFPWIYSIRIIVINNGVQFSIKDCLTNHGQIKLLPLKPTSKPHPEFTSDTLTLHPIGLY